MSYDVIVVGLGAMGSSAAYQLAKRGARVLGIEAFGRAHELGSSGGKTRIIRLAYFEHPDYVPLLRAAWELWPKIEQESGDRLLQVTGGLYVGKKDSVVFGGAMESAQRHGLAYELLDAQETEARFPALRVGDDMQGLHEPLAGILFPEPVISAHLRLAQDHAAELHFEERVTGWSTDAGGVHVTTSHGTHDADRLIIAAGAWLPKLVPELNLPLTVERNVLFWFEPAAEPEKLAPDNLPVWIMEIDDEHAFYGFPDLPGEGVKVARHHGGRQVDPDTVDRGATAEDERPVREFMKAHLPLANGRTLDSAVCMYTNTPDYNFILDFHPDDQRVVIASPCSGHGFKFSNVIGQICADLALDGTTEFDITFLSLARLGGLLPTGTPT